MKSLKFHFLIGFLLAASCCKQELPPYYVDGEGVIISMPFQWKYSLHATPSNSAFGYVDVPVVYQKNILIHTSDEDGKGRLSMVSGETGKLKWNWNDIFQNTSGGDYQISFLLFYDNRITWQVGARSYCIDLENGSTFWKKQRENNFAPRIHQYSSGLYFTTSIVTREDGHDESVAYLGDIETGELSEFLRANYSGDYASPFTDNGWVGGIVHMNPLPSYDSLIVVTYAEPLPEWQIKSFIGLYNTEAEAWVYERKQLVEPHWNAGVQNTPIIYNERVYAAAGNSIVCHDVMTGDQLWRRNFEQDFLFSGFIIEDGMLLANCEDTYTYRLNPHTGATIWRTKGAGTCSRMSYLNGVVYFVGGSTGFLHALDAETGRVLWRIDARRLGEPNGNFTTNAVYCIPGEGGGRGRVVALTGRYAYCFEAAR